MPKTPRRLSVMVEKKNPDPEKAECTVVEEEQSKSPSIRRSKTSSPRARTGSGNRDHRPGLGV